MLIKKADRGEKDYTATVIASAAGGACLANAIFPGAGLFAPIAGALIAAYIGKELEDKRTAR